MRRSDTHERGRGHRAAFAPQAAGNATATNTQAEEGWAGSHASLPRQVILRNELRQSLKDVEAGVTKAESLGPRVDPVVEEARAAAREKQKLPLHLRGTIVLT
jgi:hypothetical protein